MSEKVGLYITFWAAPGRTDELLKEVRTMLNVVRDEGGDSARSERRDGF